MHACHATTSCTHTTLVDAKVWCLQGPDAVTYENLSLAHFLDKADQLAASAESVKALNAQVCFCQTEVYSCIPAQAPFRAWCTPDLSCMHSCVYNISGKQRLSVCLLSKAAAQQPSSDLPVYETVGTGRIGNKKGFGGTASLGPGTPLHSVSVLFNIWYQVSPVSTTCACQMHPEYMQAS